ncbi:hypothetical protein ACP70R_031622 [Stipagrostis hirtigluma subsp. patula]
MVVSFRLGPRRRRVYTPPPPAPEPGPAPTSAHAADDPRPRAAAYDVDESPSPLLPSRSPLPTSDVSVSRVDNGIAARSPDGDEIAQVESDIAPSFVLNLFPDGYSIGDPGKGMLSFLIGDDPNKRPYGRSSKTLFSDIEHGSLPLSILQSIPCHFRNGSTVCEVRDYRYFVSNGGDCSGDDFPKVNRVTLGLGTECIVKHLSLIADASWTYHDQLIAESILLNVFKPRLNLDPTPCLEKLCNSSVKKINLGLDKGRQQNKDASCLNISTDAPDNGKPGEFIVCKGAAVCIDNAALEGMPIETLNTLLVNCPSSINVNNAKSSVESDRNNVIRPSSTVTSSSALCGRKQSASCTPASDHLLQSKEQQAQVEILQVDHKKGQPQRVSVLPWKRKKSSELLHQRDETENCSPPNKIGRFSSQNSYAQKSTSTSDERLELGSPKEKGDGTVHLTTQKQSVLPTSHPYTCMNTSNPCIERIPEKVFPLHRKMREHHKAPVDLVNSCVSDLKDSRTPPVTSFKASSRKASYRCHEDKTAAEPQCTASKRKVSGTSTVSLDQEMNLNMKRQQKDDAQIKGPCENRSSKDPSGTAGTSSQLGTSLDLESCIGHLINTSEPDIEKILSEVILTTQRHGLNGKAAKSDGLETAWSLSPSEFSHSENTVGIPYMMEETLPYYATIRTTNIWKIRRLTFHPSQYLSCNGTVDESHYTLCLLESQAQDDHQITVGTICGDEQIHIATLPTSHHAERFVDQFVSLMKRDGFDLCNDTLCHEPSECRKKFEDVSHLDYLSGDYPQHLMPSASVANSLVISENSDIGYTYQDGLPGLHPNILQQGGQQWVLTEQCPKWDTSEALFLNPSHPGDLQYTSSILQDYGQSFARGVFAMDLHQFPPVQLSQEVCTDQYLQWRHDTLQPSDRYGASTSGNSYRQWRQVYTEMGNVVYQWDLPAFGRQNHYSPPLNDGRSTFLPELHPIGSTQMSSWSMEPDDGSVTSTLAELPGPLSYQYLSYGLC